MSDSSILSSRKYLIVSIVALLITPVIYLEQGFGSTVKNIPLIDVVFRVQPVELTPRVLFYFPVKFLMTILCVTLPLPVGLFAPVFLLGGVLGRIVGKIIAFLCSVFFFCAHSLNVVYTMSEHPARTVSWVYCIIQAR